MRCRLHGVLLGTPSQSIVHPVYGTRLSRKSLHCEDHIARIAACDVS